MGLTLINRSLFWGEKNCPQDSKGSVSQTRPICQLRINLDTCKSNEKELYLLKSPNSLQEGAVSTPLVGGRPYTVNKQGAC